MEKILDVVFILDKSGSMSGNVENTISSFNEYLEKEKKNLFETRITTILFSDNHNFLHKQRLVKNVKPLTDKEYHVEGCTALYDALGDGIHFLEQNASDKALFIVITDGYENASKEYSQIDIQRMIKSHSDWEFIYIGADIDSYVGGSSIGIKTSNIANFKKTKSGTSKLFRAITDFECCMMEKDCSINWKEKLEY